MTNNTPILIDEYNYPLPDERIAKYPLAQRDHSKLLIYRDGQVKEDKFFNIGKYIPQGSLLVYNNTRVIQARLVFHKSTGARIEIFCLTPIEPYDYQLSLSSTTGCEWRCMIGNAKKFNTDSVEMPIHLGTRTLRLRATKGEQQGNTYAVEFTWDAPDVSFSEILEAVGELPIPPYLNRKSEESDKRTYQTVYSRIEGSVAAPTAGLHFTGDVLNNLRSRGVHMTELTLHVGAGTFQPVKTADANEHTMHTEIIAVPKQAILDIMNNLGHIVAVGTTSMRTLESLYYIGLKLRDLFAHFPYEDCSMADYPFEDLRFDLHVDQFEPYKQRYDISPQQALQEIIYYLNKTKQNTLHAETQIMIRPGYEFRIVDQLITNFHQPKSTLLLLVSAFVGGDWRTIYDYALSHDFRFLSYGDSSILFRR